MDAPHRDRRSDVLSGIVVVDLTSFLSGPFCTQILGDLGATIIKVEPPGGDATRAVPPYEVAGDSAYFLCANRNKHSIRLDLHKSEAVQVLRKMVARADVLVENYRPGVLARLGLTREAVREANRGLVWCAISGFGQDGPYRDRPAYDLIVQGLSGGMSLTGEEGGMAVRAGLPIADLSAGLYGAIGILAALHDARRTGRGREIDVAMLDCQVAMLSYQASYHLNAGVVPGRQGRGHDSIPTYRAFVARDGKDVLVAATTERMWIGLTEVLGHPEWQCDPRFATSAARNRNRATLISLLEAVFATRPADAWLDELVAAQIPCAPVNDLASVFADPQVQHRGMALTIAGGAKGSSARVVGDPLRMSGSGEAHRYPPRLGADGEQILRWLVDADEEQLRALERSGAWIPPGSPHEG